MKTFKQFLEESALERKIEKGFHEQPLNIPGTTVLHHEPEKKLTVYQAHTPEATCKLSSGLGQCTSGNNGLDWSKKFLRKGTMFFVHHKGSRLQVHISHDKPLEPGDVKSDRDEMSGNKTFETFAVNSGFYDPSEGKKYIRKHNESVWKRLGDRIGPEVVNKMRTTPHENL